MTHDFPPSSRLAHAALWVALLALGATLAGPLAARLGLLPPFAGFLVFAVGLVPGAVFSLVLGAAALYRTRRGDDRTGWRRSLVATLVGAGLFGVLAALAGDALSLPPIHDVTTDPADPPRFVAVARLPENRERDLAYPHGEGDIAAQQREAYPDLEPIRLPLGPDAAFGRALETARGLGWTIVEADPEARRVEAYDTSAVFGFLDDVVIRVRPAGDTGSVIDVRSTSRVGRSDLGANAARIRAFRDALQTASSRPATG